MASAAATIASTAFRSTTDCCYRGAKRVLRITALQVASTRRSSAFFKSVRTINTKACTTASRCSSSGFTKTATITEASAYVIDGKSTAKEIRDEIAIEISRMKVSIGVVPGLSVILVGDRKDSATYVRNKKKACESVGIKSYEVHLAEDSSEQEVLKHISGFNDDPSVHAQEAVRAEKPSWNATLCWLVRRKIVDCCSWTKVGVSDEAVILAAGRNRC